ncbi:MAG: DUF1553 domain-containing protein [Roseibacillus sp.]|jgi:hypothetical protein
MRLLCALLGLTTCAALSAIGEEDERLKHWAWQPVSSSRPEMRIDDFVRASLRENGLAMSAPADRRTLIRRLSFNLHGLPPAPRAVEDFVSDPDPQAYEKLVDAMLSSPHYGERFARHWLDIAHYADTHGFERDRRRAHAWRYRDYVIDAFNGDKPYDRFLQEQVAGDVLWPDDPGAVIATGFLAAGPWDFVGQVETKSPVLRRSARSLDLDDMATQVMTSTMGVTINCARCHDHKLDPISQEEYYRLRAVFAGVKRSDRKVGEKARGTVLAARATVVAEIKSLAPGLDLADIVGGGDGRGGGKARQGLDPRTGSAASKPMGFLDKVRPNRFAPSGNKFVDGVFIPKGAGGQARITVSSTGLTVTGIRSDNAQAWDIIRNGPVNSQHSPELGGINFADGENSLLGLHANAGITFDLAVFRRELAAETLRFTAQVGYFGHQKNDAFADVWVFMDGKQVVVLQQLKRADNLKTIEVVLPKTARFLTLMSTDGGNGISMDQVGFGAPTVTAASSALPEGKRERLAKLRSEKKKLDAKLASLTPSTVFAIVPEEKMPAVRVLQRGDPESPRGDPLDPGALAVLRMLDPDFGEATTTEGERRAALVRWITAPGNPLTARVIVNRVWHWHFGRGLVATPSDFGMGGGMPSHPELLDWLAAELPRQNWSLKAMHRLVLNSATYKQDSRSLENAPGLAIDAGNRFLWRQNPRRIEAEAVRDAVLSVSGKLNLKRGGPGFEDFHYKEAYAPEYTYFTADKPALWRRSIYRYIVRTTPDRFLTTLDCPDPANFTPVRLITTTPLQSLALYNNEFMLRQARYFAQRVEKEARNSPSARMARAFELALGRKPSAQELQLGTRFIEQQSLFSFCRALFNANEFVYVD